MLVSNKEHIGSLKHIILIDVTKEELDSMRFSIAFTSRRTSPVLRKECSSSGLSIHSFYQLIEEAKGKPKKPLTLVFHLE